MKRAAKSGAKRSLRGEFPVGALVHIARASAINAADEVGVVVENYRIGRDDGVSILFEGGGYDGFSAKDIEVFGVTRLNRQAPVRPEIANYEFRSVIRLEEDFRAGVFQQAFGDGRAGLMATPARSQ